MSQPSARARAIAAGERYYDLGTLDAYCAVFGDARSTVDRLPLVG